MDIRTLTARVSVGPQIAPGDMASGGRSPASEADASFEVVIVGGGAAGIAVAASLHRRQPRADIAIIDPADVHYYQPGWTMVGGSISEAAQTVRTMGSLIPEAVRWIKAGVAAFDPGTDSVILEGRRIIRYERLIVCPSLKLDWDAVEGLPPTLGRNGATSNYRDDLVAVGGTRQAATFDVRRSDAPAETVEMEFDMLHVCPPQTAPDFIRVSPLADAGGWVDVDRSTLRHTASDNIWSLGDVTYAPNAKTAAAACAQAPVVAENIAADMAGRAQAAQYNGYGSCPLTVERGKVVLAEFGYGGTLLPTFPKALIDGTRPSRAAWLLKEKILPTVYWQGMLKGREWLVRPETIPVE